MTSLEEAVIRQTTNEWVEYMSDPASQIGIFARLALTVLPEGVDPSDIRVQAILAELARVQAGVLRFREEESE